MNRKIAKLVAIIAVIIVSAFATARTEPNSFLNKKADSHSALMSQIQNDDQVMNRFMRHFGMTRSEVVAYFNTLKLDTIKEDAVYLVYNVPESEEIRARAIFYKAGTKVWVDPQGNLVLKASCGNPMVRGTDSTTVNVQQTVAQSILEPNPTVPTPQGSAADFVVNTLPTDVESSALAFPASTPLDVLSTSSAGGGFNPAFLVPAAAIPFIIRDGDNPPDVIPEPATMVALGVGAAALVARKRRQ
jgi:hypothetical protein